MTRVGGDWLGKSATQRLFRVYAKAGHSLFVVGGCVRNDLLGQPVSDIDMASATDPETATRFLTSAGLKVIPTGIDHGTITVVSDGVAHEITTFRKDVETDGRRATIAFAQCIHEDAARRDFTINALYADATGHVIDPVDGLADVRARRVRFIGRAQDRIREDYLRTLRFFRFHAWYADDAQGFEPDALDAMSSNLDGIEQLSRERIGAEMIKLLWARNPGPAVMVMDQIGVLSRVLPGANARALGPLIHMEDLLGLSPDPMRRLASFAAPERAKTLRLSKVQLRHLIGLHRVARGTEGPGEMGFRLGETDGLGALALRSAFLEHPVTDNAKADVIRGAQATFPIRARDLSSQFTGLALGEKLRALESEWIASGFTKTKRDLLG